MMLLSKAPSSTDDSSLVKVSERLREGASEKLQAMPLGFDCWMVNVERDVLLNRIVEKCINYPLICHATNP